MKVFEPRPGGFVLTPQAQQWLGILLFFGFLLNGIQSVVYQWNSVNRVFGIMSLVASPAWLKFSWDGYRRRPKP